MAYVDYALTVDMDAIVAGVLADIATTLGVTLNEGDPVVAAAEALALRIAETRVVMIDVAAVIFDAFGQKVVGVTRVPAAAATMTVEFTVADTDGYTIPAGTRLVYRRTGSTTVGFATTAELTIDPGSATGTVTAEALVSGEDANGLTAAALVLADPLVFVTGVESTTTSSGGVDAETPADYLDRLADELRLLSLVPRLEDEYALVARRVPGVYRARDIARYDADTDTPDSPGHVTVIVVDADGAALDAGVKADVQDVLDSEDTRALNVVVHVIDPTLQAVTVDFTAVAEPGADPVTVEQAAIAAVEGYLGPGTWAGGGEDPPLWRDVDTVRYLELAALLNGVSGLDYLTALTLDGGTADVALVGVGVLPDPTVTGDVQSP